MLPFLYKVSIITIFFFIHSFMQCKTKGQAYAEHEYNKGYKDEYAF